MSDEWYWSTDFFKQNIGSQNSEDTKLRKELPLELPKLHKKDHGCMQGKEQIKI